MSAQATPIPSASTPDSQIPDGPTPEELVSLANSIRDSITVGMNDRTGKLRSVLSQINASIDEVANVLDRIKQSMQQTLDNQGKTQQEKERAEEQLKNLSLAHKQVQDALFALRDAYDNGVKELAQVSGDLENVPATMKTKLQDPIGQWFTTTGGKKRKHRRTKKGGYKWGNRSSKKHSKTSKTNRSRSRKLRKSRK